jgi:hypothetical protein
LTGVTAMSRDSVLLLSPASSTWKLIVRVAFVGSSFVLSNVIERSAVW